MSKSYCAAFACILTVLGFACAADAANYTCPAPNLVNCWPVQQRIGPWRYNGGLVIGNTFAPNSQCGNVYTMANGEKFLLCCYTKCTGFYLVVKATECTKTSQSEFTCK